MPELSWSRLPHWIQPANELGMRWPHRLRIRLCLVIRSVTQRMAEQELLGRASPFSQAWYAFVFLALSSWLLLHFLSKTRQHWGQERRTSLCMGSRLQDNASRTYKTHLALNSVGSCDQGKKEQVYRSQQSSNMTTRTWGSPQPSPHHRSTGRTIGNTQCNASDGSCIERYLSVLRSVISKVIWS